MRAISPNASLSPDSPNSLLLTPTPDASPQYCIETTAYQAGAEINIVMVLRDDTTGIYVWSESFRLALQQIDRMREPGPTPPPPPPSLEERVTAVERNQAIASGEALVALPAMVEFVALALASAQAEPASPSVIRENAGVISKLPAEGETDWHRDHVAIGRNMAVLALLRIADLLDTVADVQRRCVPSPEGVQ